MLADMGQLSERLGVLLALGEPWHVLADFPFPVSLTSSPEVDAFGFSWELHTLFIRLCLLSTSRLLLAVYI